MVVMLMGVTGSGKTTVGEQLAAELGWTFSDADDFHPRGQQGEDARRHSAHGRRPLAVAAGGFDSVIEQALRDRLAARSSRVRR